MARREASIWLHLRPGRIDWAWYPPGAAQPERQGRCADLTEVPAPPGTLALVCVPGELVRVHAVSLPTRKRRRMLAALPYALEDCLLHAPEAYHLVPLPAPRGAPATPVAVVEHARMAQWLAAVAARGWPIRALYPDYAGLPAPAPDRWLLEATESPLLLRTPQGTGAALCERLAARPPGALLIALQQAAAPPRALQVCTRGDAQRAAVECWRSALARYELALDIEPVDTPRATRLARPQSPMRPDLLQGAYRPAVAPAAGGRAPLRTAALAAALLAAAAIHWTIGYAGLRREHVRLEAAIESVYRQAFPDAVNLIDPRFQMEQRLVRLRAAGTSTAAPGRLPALLERVAPLLTGGELLGYRYTGDQLLLDISVPDFDRWDSLQARIAASLPVDTVGAELREGRVYGQLRIAVPAS